MVIKEVFPNPTVKEVVFQINFSNLFAIENKIGEFQEKIINKFPDSSLARRRSITFVDASPNYNAEDIRKHLFEEPGNKIWQFRSPNNFKLNILTNSLDIVSEYHKTYSNEGGEKFREIISYTLDNFFKIFSIPILKRVGLRYIDHCPMPSRNTSEFLAYYNSSFPLKKFNLKDAEIMEFKTIVKRNGCFLGYREFLKTEKDQEILILDFDGFAENIKSEKCLNITDKLHEIISNEYENTIKNPVFKYMKKKEVQK